MKYSSFLGGYIIKYKISLLALTLVILFAFSSCDISAILLPEPVSETEEVTSATFELTFDRDENGVIYLDYLMTIDASFYDLANTEKEALAETVIDEGLKHLRATYPEINSLWIIVYTQKTELAMSIEIPSETKSPKVEFHRFMGIMGAVPDYYWYDIRHGDGEPWE